MKFRKTLTGNYFHPQSGVSRYPSMGLQMPRIIVETRLRLVTTNFLGICKPISGNRETPLFGRKWFPVAVLLYFIKQNTIPIDKQMVKLSCHFNSQSLYIWRSIWALHHPSRRKFMPENSPNLLKERHLWTKYHILKLSSSPWGLKRPILRDMEHFIT